MRQVGIGYGCDHCGCYIGGGDAGRSILGGVGAGGGGSGGTMRMPPNLNPLLPTMPVLKKGDTVGFAPLNSEHSYVGTIAHIETDEDNGMVTITLED